MTRQIVGVPRPARVRPRREPIPVPPALAADAAALGARPAGRPGLRTEAPQVTAALRTVVQAGAGLGVTPLAGPAEERIVLEIDPRAGLVAGLIIPALKEAVRVGERAGVKVEVLTGLLAKFRGMATLHLSAEALDQAIADSLAVLGELQRRLRGEMREAYESLRAEPGLDAGLAARLRSAGAQVDEVERRQREAQSGRAADTTRERRAFEGRLADAADHADMVRTMLDLQRGEAVAEDRAAAAAARLADEEAAPDPAADTATDRRAGDR